MISVYHLRQSYICGIDKYSCHQCQISPYKLGNETYYYILIIAAWLIKINLATKMDRLIKMVYYKLVYIKNDARSLVKVIIQVILQYFDYNSVLSWNSSLYYAISWLNCHLLFRSTWLLLWPAILPYQVLIFDLTYCPTKYLFTQFIYITGWSISWLMFRSLLVII